MGGEPKGLLKAPDTGETIIDKLARLGRELGMRPLMVGAASAYESIDLDAITDAPTAEGPLAGLLALLALGDERVVAVACDMPHVSKGALERLLAHAPDAAVVAPRRDEDAPWEPLFARYDPVRVRPVVEAAAADGVRSFQALFRRLEVEALPIDPAIEAALGDWDTPDDVKR